MNKEDILTGLSAFNNSYWKGIFYPEDLPAVKRFDYYCGLFKTYEINSTFYKFPTIKSLKNWYNKSPDDFVFAVKAHKGITHYKRFVDCKAEIDEFYNLCREGLGSKLGPVLFQLPPSFSYSRERLNLIISSLNPEFNNVVEFRNESWWTQEVFDAFARHGITFCSVSYPKLPATIIQTTNTLYVRLYGVPNLFYSGYDKEYLASLYNSLAKLPASKKVYIYFNNTASDEGVLNALYFMNYIEEH